MRRALLQALWLGCGLAFAGFSARAEAPPPPPEFWNYLLEFGDANGELFDPSDLAMARQVQLKNAAKKKDATSGQPNVDSAVEQQRESRPASAPVAPAERSE